MDKLPSTIDEMVDFLSSAPPEVVEQLKEQVHIYTDKCWLPQAGPQYEAYHHPAEELLYGGAAGGGKSDLLIGLATTAHEKSVIFRRQSTDLDGLWERLIEVIGDKLSTNNSVKKRTVMLDGRLVEGGHLEKPGSEKTWQGRPHDLIGVDEGAQVDEHKINFVMQWLRTTTKGQRARLVVATNPPLPEIVNGRMVDMGTGDWLMRWWAPWLDDHYPDPAEPGEIRWCFMVADGEYLKTIWVPGPGTYNPVTHEPIENPTPEDVREGRAVHAKSRTFIKSLLKDNAYLKDSGYAERMSGTPEPLRSMLMNGAFNVRLADGAMQVIPTNWVLAAQAKWHEREKAMASTPQLVLSADIAQGGIDNTTIVELLKDDTFLSVDSTPGVDTPDGPSVVAKLLQRRRNRSMIVLDGTGGWAGDTARTLQDRHNITAELFVASQSDGGMDRNMEYRFKNKRAAMWWRFREALDPDSEYDIALPPSPRLLAQLTAPSFAIEKNVIQIEGKDALRIRLGSSTDDADCVLQAWYFRDEAHLRRLTEQPDIITRLNDPDFGKKSLAGAPVDDVNPLEGW